MRMQPGLGMRNGGAGTASPPSPPPPPPPTGALSELGNNGAIPSGAVFTRTGTGWYFDENGDVQSVAEDNPRYGYDDALTYVGLQIGGACTNYARNNDDYETEWQITSGAWSTGTMNFNGSEGARAFEQLASAGGTNTFEMHRYTAADAGKVVRFNSGGLSSELSEDVSIPSHGLIRQKLSKSVTGTYCRFRNRSSGAVQSLTPTTGAFVFSHQLIDGPIVTTSTAAVTRNAETCVDSIVGGDTSSLVLTANAVAAQGFDIDDQTWLQVDDGTDDNRIVVRRESTGNVWCRRYSGGVLQSSIDLGAVVDGGNVLVECESTASTFRARIDGGAIQTDNAGSHPTVTTARYGSSVAGEHMFGILLGTDQTTGTSVVSGTLS